MKMENKHCNIFLGKWVKDYSYPYYPVGSCPHMDESFNCFRNKPPDEELIIILTYEEWRINNYSNIEKLFAVTVTRRQYTVCMFEFNNGWNALQWIIIKIKAKLYGHGKIKAKHATHIPFTSATAVRFLDVWESSAEAAMQNTICSKQYGEHKMLQTRTGMRRKNKKGNVETSRFPTFFLWKLVRNWWHDIAMLACKSCLQPTSPSQHKFPEFPTFRYFAASRSEASTTATQGSRMAGGGGMVIWREHTRGSRRSMAMRAWEAVCMGMAKTQKSLRFSRCH